MAVPFLDLQCQHESLLPELRRRFEQLVRSGQFVLGPSVAAFEQALAAYCGARHAIGISSGTDALLVGLMALGIGPGDEVITTPFTFFATAGSIARLGARPVFVDIDEATYNMDPGHLEQAVTPATKAIIPVHLYGQVADMEPILRFVNTHGLTVVEDVAQAAGAAAADRRAGTFGHVGCFSFYPTKNLAGIGDGGACTLDDDELDHRIRILRNHGQDPKDPKHIYEQLGGNFRLDAIQAMVLGAKLPQLDAWNAMRRCIAQRYRALLEGMPIDLPVETSTGHVYNLYTIRVRGGRRDALHAHLTSRKIGSQVYYRRPLHLQPCLAHLGYSKGDLPVAEQAADEVLSLPMYPQLPASGQEEVAVAIREFFSNE